MKSNSILFWASNELSAFHIQELLFEQKPGRMPGNHKVTTNFRTKDFEVKVLTELFRLHFVEFA